MNNRKKLLFITPSLPVTADSGGLIVTMERLEILSRQFDVTVLTISTNEEAISTHTKSLGLVSVFSAGELKPRNIKNWLFSLWHRKPLSVWRNMPSEFIDKCKSLPEVYFDVVYVDHWLMWPAVEKIKYAKKRILNLHNAEHLLFTRAAEQAKLPVSLILKFEGYRVSRYLRKICSTADEVHYLSQIDANEVRKLGGLQGKYRVFLPSVPIPEGEFGRFGKNILFVGTMSWAPNADGIRWYLKEVVPHLNAELTTHIIGGYLSADDHVEHSNVVWHGRVPDLNPFYKTASVFIAPLLNGSGIKLKLLNAMAHSIPVITTPPGVEGFPNDFFPAITVAKDGMEFAADINKLCADVSHWTAAASSTQDYLLQYFSPVDFTTWTVETAN